ncbi:sulfatase [Halomicrobium salinisoli]|uniref:sulfatase n=1 Tax=Halomicrobium salinisoli TaxID=2878391 RepID=UPI001CF069B7|nr:sulfatase [Halomicrobium salinisoli]
MSDPNVLLVILDSVRARNVSAYGHHNETTPFLESFAEAATLYEQARSPGARSVTSHTSIFSGLHVEEHNVTAAKYRLDPSLSIFDRLREDGYATGVFSENNWITDVDVGLSEGFDHVVGARSAMYPDALNPESFVSNHGRGAYGDFLTAALGHDRPLQSLANGVSTKLTTDYPGLVPEFMKASTPAQTYVDEFLDWQADRDGPWAACMNLMDAHIPYDPAPEHDLWGGDRLRELQNSFEDQKWDFASGRRPWWQKEAVEALYDGTIREMDAALQRLVRALRERGELEDTLLVVTSDHGEGFGEPSDVRPAVRVAEHGVAIHDVLLHVPLLVRFPGQTDGERVAAPASLTEFPRVVEGVREGTADRDAFCPDGPVISSAVGLDEPLQDRASQYVDDLSPWLATSRAVFEERPGEDAAVVKYCTNREAEATIGVRDAQSSFALDEAAAARVDAAFADVDDAGVRSEGDGVEDVGDTTYQRLEDLGYV